jgi:uncharacterized protein (DUF1501 family)
MKCAYACRSAEHFIARRSFLGGLASGAAALGLGTFARPAVARELASQGKRVLAIFLHGGVSQLESWDPKPGTDTGGPFRAIPTTVPGVHISELLPHTAREMHRMALVRSLNTAEDDHGKGAYLMETGRRQEPAGDYPHLGAVCARALAPEGEALPGFIRITPGGSGGTSRDSAYLGPRYASVSLGNGQPPRNSALPPGLSEASFARRNQLRHALNDHFSSSRRTSATEAYTYSYEQAFHLMEKRAVFDAADEPPKVAERYGAHDFGRHCLLARRLLERGVTFVQVAHTNYDTHNENFDFHLEQLGEFDHTFATLLEDLDQRGMLASTLVIVMSEFGRTPRINHLYGRDHWSKAWSVALAGCGIQAGALIGKTNANGTEVSDRQVHHGHLFHTYLRALGLNPAAEFVVGGRKVPMANPADAPIRELLA